MATTTTAPTSTLTRKVSDIYDRETIWRRVEDQTSPSGKSWYASTEDGGHFARVHATTAEYRRFWGLPSWAKAVASGYGSQTCGYHNICFENVTEALEDRTRWINDRMGVEAPIYMGTALDW